MCIYIYTHTQTHPFPLEPSSYPPHLTPLGHHRALSWAPCVIWQLPTSFLFYIQLCLYVNATLSICPTLPFPSASCPQVGSLRLSLHSCPENRFISTICLDSIYTCCCFSVAKLRLTLCNPMDRSMPGLPVFHYLPEFIYLFFSF